MAPLRPVRYRPTHLLRPVRYCPTHLLRSVRRPACVSATPYPLSTYAPPTPRRATPRLLPRALPSCPKVFWFGDFNYRIDQPAELVI
eukprot:3319248-Rhodomonas_salina.1